MNFGSIIRNYRLLYFDYYVEKREREGESPIM